VTPPDRNKSQLDEARDCLIREVNDGLRHGFFDLAVTCETVNGKKRRLTIKAGKNHRFTIPEEEIE
ncbi:MAG: hypothetical protein WBM97_16430, partial [Sedimenticolaceae bacterium]